MLWQARMEGGVQLDSTSPQLVKVDEVWVVRVDRGRGRVQEYRCVTEQQARQLLAVLSGPATTR
jgi:hypothetical protein